MRFNNVWCYRIKVGILNIVKASLAITSFDELFLLTVNNASLTANNILNI